MKRKTVTTLMPLGGITLLTLLASPIRPAAQQRQQAEHADHPDTGTNPMPLINQPLVPDADGPTAQKTAPTYTVLYNFTGHDGDGADPPSGVAVDTAGNLYGTTVFGGTAGYGVVFKLDPEGNETVLHTFTGSTDGSEPGGPLILDTAGNLYGTTTYGGTAGYGVVFKLDTAGNETVLHSFANVPDGAWPYGSLATDAAGNLYGTTSHGGADNAGAIFKVDTAGNETVLHSFAGANGAYPEAGLTRDAAGNFYGTTSSGGDGYGVVFKVDPAGNGSVLYSFTGADGWGPYAGLTRDAAGNLYGTTHFGGDHGYGVVFKLDAAGNESVLYSFTGWPNGENPNARLIRDAAGNLYGTTQVGGGRIYFGVVFKLDPSGNETVLHSFTGGADGAYPGSLLHYKGSLYGTTGYGGSHRRGVVFKIQLP